MEHWVEIMNLYPFFVELFLEHPTVNDKFGILIMLG